MFWSIFSIFILVFKSNCSLQSIPFQNCPGTQNFNILEEVSINCKIQAQFYPDLWDQGVEMTVLMGLLRWYALKWHHKPPPKVESSTLLMPITDRRRFKKKYKILNCNTKRGVHSQPTLIHFTNLFLKFQGKMTIL